MNRAPLFKSTRSTSLVSFKQAILEGLAPDGGLYIPEFVPNPGSAWRESDSFTQLATSVFRQWFPDDPSGAGSPGLIEGALNFPIPLRRLEKSASLGRDVWILELFHGPTLSFKDFGARMMARWMGAYLKAEGKRVTILVATSGDTGSAVADSFSGLEGVDVVLLYPLGKVSAVQEKQLIVERPGVRTLAVQGSFDDCQSMVKAAFTDPDLAGLSLSSANSINIGRLLPQSLFYLEASRIVQDPSLVFCTPSGNLGNLTGGILASLGGLETEKFVAAHNANRFFPDFMKDGLEGNRKTIHTASNAMDVGVPSNFERLKALLPGSFLHDRVSAYTFDDVKTRRVMQTVLDETGYLACPHTSVGLAAAIQYRHDTGSSSPIVVLATAHPAKFPDVVKDWTEVDVEVPDALRALDSRPVSVTPIEANVDALRSVLLGG